MKQIVEYDEAYALLVELSERYQELPLHAHLCVMEAFTIVVESEAGPPECLPTVEKAAPAEVMKRAQELLRDLQRAAPTLAEALLFSRARTLMIAARAELQ